METGKRQLTAAPGFVDLHVHFRDPGFPQKENIVSGAAAAAAGGFTTVCMMPNTQPPIDCVETLLYADARGRAVSLPVSACASGGGNDARAGIAFPGGADSVSAGEGVNIFAAAAMTIGQNGKTLADFAAMDAAPTQCWEKTGHGICGITEDGKSLLDDELMERVATEAARLGLLVMDHAEDRPRIPPGACMNEGVVSRRLGLAGIPREAEARIVCRDIGIAKKNGTRFHIQHVSCAESVAWIRRAKREGVPITCETAPHYFALTEDAVLQPCGADVLDATWDAAAGAVCGRAMAKMNPPLRTEQDRLAIIEGLADGTIDCIATDHAPHEEAVKRLPMPDAAFGVVGLETAFAVSYTALVVPGHIAFTDLIRLMSGRPAELIGMQAENVRLAELPRTQSADLPETKPDMDTASGRKAGIRQRPPGAAVFLDLGARYKIDRNTFASRGRNTPFHGMAVTGRVAATICGGRIVYIAPGYEADVAEAIRRFTGISSEFP
jgi:dihydroorotase